MYLCVIASVKSISCERDAFIEDRQTRESKKVFSLQPAYLVTCILYLSHKDLKRY